MPKLPALALCLLCLAVIARAQEAPRAGQLAVESYAFKTFDGREHPAELGRLWVRENRASNSSRLVRLAFVRLRSTAEHPAAPVVWLAGGPGVPGVAMARVPVYFSLFERLREVSDVILLDQRGTGMSEPSLECARADVPADVFESDEKWLRAYAALTDDCARAWRAKNVDLAAYTNDASADDLEDLRRALGAERLSLVGHSYGTLLAQAFMRRHPERIERAVLAGVEGTDDLIALPGVWDVLVKKLSRLAAADATAGREFPDVEALCRRVLEGLAREPAVVTVTDRRTKQPVRLRVGATGLQWLMRMAMADGRSYGSLPALLATIDRGDYSILSKRVEPLYNGFGGRSPMANAVECSVGWSPGRMARASGEAPGAIFRIVNLQWGADVCRSLGINPLRSAPAPRLWSTAPVLLVSGTLDTNTPPYQAEELRWGLPESTHLVVENGGHETLPSDEVQSAVVDFFKGADVGARRVAFERPRFLSVEELKSAAARGGGPGR